MRRRRWLMLMLFILAIPLLLAPSGSESSKPKHGGTATYVIGADPLGFDIHTEITWPSGELLANIYSTLLRYNEKGEVSPELAKSWKISRDGLNYTFRLRDDVYFHNGRKMTSEDVKFSINRILDPKTGSPRRENFLVIDRIETPDDKTVKIFLKEPFAPLLVNLADPWNGIVPREIFDDGSIKKRPIGTGPFMIKERVAGDYILLERNPKYFKKGLPYLDYLRLKVIQEDTALVAAMRSKTVDLTLIWGKLFDLLKPVKDVKIEDLSTISFGMLEFNCRRPPFDNPKVRLAVAYAVNRQEIIESVMFGHANVIAPIHETMPYYSVDWKQLPGYQQDYDKARALLKEAGRSDGFTFELKADTAWVPHLPAAQVIQSQLKPIGAKAEIIPMEWGALIQDKINRNFDANFMTYPSYPPDPDTLLYRWFHSKGAWNMGFSDPEVDRLLEQGRRTMDPKVRREIYHKAQFRIAEQAAAILAFRFHLAAAYQPYLKPGLLTPYHIYWDEAWLDK